jgi:hypothetical protein
VHDERDLTNGQAELQFMVGGSAGEQVPVTTVAPPPAGALGGVMQAVVLVVDVEIGDWSWRQDRGVLHCRPVLSGAVGGGGGGLRCAHGLRCSWIARVGPLLLGRDSGAQQDGPLPTTAIYGCTRTTHREQAIGGLSACPVPHPHPHP